jgi:TM2 domain-containing membrane protein YozV
MSQSAPPGWYPHPDDPSTEYWWDGMQYTVSRPRPSAPVVYAGVPRLPGVSPKSRLVATLLGFFLGGLGVHRFYLGNIGMGVALLLVGWLTFGIWPLIDWILVIAGQAHDGDGLLVSDWQ